MHLTRYRSRTILTVPSELFDVFDGYNDSFEAAFAHYDDRPMDVVVASGTIGEERGHIHAALIVTVNHIITGYIDMLGDADAPPDWQEDEDGPWIPHQEPSAHDRLTQMLAYYKLETKAAYLVVHDADDPAAWVAHGFTLVPPPADGPIAAVVAVLSWGTVPGGVYRFLAQQELVWDRATHRGE